MHSAARLECGRKPCGARFLRDRADAHRTNRMAPGAARCRWPQQHGQSRTLFGQSQRGSGKGPLRQPRAPGVILLTRLQGLSQSSPSRTSQIDPVPAQCTELSIADCDGPDNALATEYLAHHWRAYSPLNAAAYEDGLGTEVSQPCPSVGSSVGTKLLLLACQLR